jgi:hypothetical protein
MQISLKVYEPFFGQFRQIQTEIDIQFRSMVDSVSDLPILDTSTGDLRMVRENKHIYVSYNGEWIDQGVFDTEDLKEYRLMQALS